jgi:hypothetical protein
MCRAAWLCTLQCKTFHSGSLNQLRGKADAGTVGVLAYDSAASTPPITEPK